MKNGNNFSKTASYWGNPPAVCVLSQFGWWSSVATIAMGVAKLGADSKAPFRCVWVLFRWAKIHNGSVMSWVLCALGCFINIQLDFPHPIYSCNIALYLALWCRALFKEPAGKGRRSIVNAAYAFLFSTPQLYRTVLLCFASLIDSRKSNRFRYQQI